MHVSRLVELHLRFHTYQLGWTDSALRRYARDAGDLLDRLNALTPADCTTRNENKVERSKSGWTSSRSASLNYMSASSSTQSGRSSTATR